MMGMRVYVWWKNLSSEGKMDRLWWLFKWFLIIGILQAVLSIVEMYIRMNYLGVV